MTNTKTGDYGDLPSLQLALRLVITENVSF